MNGTSQQEFGAFLRVRRTSRGLTQVELARQLDVTPETICRWERGKNRPRRQPPLRSVLAAGVAPPPRRPSRRLTPERVATIAAGLAQVVLDLRAFD
jgi:transcriptional regulator with XRE-family HTH domain